jgi:hypothetical protein
VAHVHSAAAKALFVRDVDRFPEVLLQERRWTILERAYPILEVLFEADARVPLRVRLTCEEWNALPPSIKLLSKGGGALAKIPTAPGAQLHSVPHPATGLPFVCMVGTREYHTHPRHLRDAWDNYRHASGYDIGGILTRVWRAWLTALP